VEEKIDGRRMVASAKKDCRIGQTCHYIETYGRTKDTKCSAEIDAVSHVGTMQGKRSQYAVIIVSSDLKVKTA
jgi:hypothetical protein